MVIGFYWHRTIYTIKFQIMYVQFIFMAMSQGNSQFSVAVADEFSN